MWCHDAEFAQDGLQYVAMLGCWERVSDTELAGANTIWQYRMLFDQENLIARKHKHEQQILVW